MTRRNVVLAAGAVLVLVATVCIGIFGPIVAEMPVPQGARVDGRDVVGIETGGAYAWVVPTRTGVVLVDAGIDPEAEALRREIGVRTVHAVFITHGHFDHVAGLPHFDDAQVFVGPSEAGLIAGERAPGGWMPRLLGWSMGVSGIRPPRITELRDGQTVEIEGRDFEVVHVPGHTRGSVMILTDGVLFTGDSLVGRGDGVAMLPRAFATDIAQNRASIAALEALDFDRIADGHSGLHEGAKAQVLRFLSE